MAHFFINTELNIESICLFPVAYDATLFTFAGPFFFILLYLFYDVSEDDLGVAIELHSYSFLDYEVSAALVAAIFAGLNIGKLSVPLVLGAIFLMICYGDCCVGRVEGCGPEADTGTIFIGCYWYFISVNPLPILIPLLSIG